MFRKLNLSVVVFLKINGKVRFGFFWPEYLGSPLEVVLLILVGICRPKLGVPFLANQFFALIIIREFGLIGKCCSNFLRFSHWSLTGQFGIWKAPIETRKAARSKVHVAASPTENVTLIKKHASQPLPGKNVFLQSTRILFRSSCIWREDKVSLFPKPHKKPLYNREERMTILIKI